MQSEDSMVSRTLWARYGKRVFDVLAAGVLVVLLSPVLAAAAGCVKLSSAGPVFFTQPRAGRRGKAFRVRKFRTMYRDHKHDVTETVTLAHPGITPVGRVLRRVKIDELPQIFNVLVGTMSLVGPRPGLLSQAEAYDDVQRRRLLLRPGCTGLAQVNSMSRGADWTDRIKYDVYYVRHCSFRLDMGILAKTLLVLMLGEKRFDRPFESSPYASTDGSTSHRP
ncbi:MAG: sugar transferase [Phycisphaerales bacterium]|nr:MAG: sugar transferase [Phycisphaerales bacterium]